MENKDKEIGQRLKEARDTLNLPMSKFGKAIGLTDASISQYENGHRTITPRSMKEIVREYNINKDWLRTGKGQMFIKISEEEKIARMFAKIMNTPDGEIKKKLLIATENLDTEELQYLIDQAKFLKNQRKKPPIDK